MGYLNKLKPLFDLTKLSKYSKIYDEYRKYTMIPRNTYIRNLVVAEKVSHLHGAVVECGVWRGGMIAGIAALLGNGKEYYAFDSFEGLPEVKEIDGLAAKQWQNNTSAESYFDNCKAEMMWVQEALNKAGVNNPKIVKGWFQDTLPLVDKQLKISLLRLDGDWYESTMTCLTSLYDLVEEGGIIVFDDYLSWVGCRKAVHDFLSQRGISAPIRQFDNDIYYIEKINYE